MTARVTWISSTPVKATMLHHLDEVELLESGPKNDRRFYMITERGRLVSNKDHGPLQLVRADYDSDADALSLRFPDGNVVEGGVARGDEVETTFHKRPRTARVVVGPWAGAVSDLIGQPVQLVEPEWAAPARAARSAALCGSSPRASANASAAAKESPAP